MSLIVSRIPLQGNEYILNSYWDKNIDSWKMNSESRMNYIHQAAQNIWLYTATKDNELCGLLVNEEGNTNAIWLLHVIPSFRRSGIGSALLNNALCNICGTWSVGVGSNYWWQGVPIDAGANFFDKHGFKWSWTSIDMLLHLNKWKIQRTDGNHHIRKLIIDEADKLIMMLKDEEELCNWVPFYKAYIDNNQLDRIYVALIDNAIVGCSMLLIEKEIRWGLNFPGRTGGISCIGVMKSHRNCGIGNSLVVTLTNELKYLGYDQSYIGYTWLEKWYGKLGYSTVYRFKMGSREAL